MKEESISKKEEKMLRKQEQEEKNVQENAQRKKSRYRLWGIIILSLVIFVAFVSWLLENRAETSVYDETRSEINAISESDHTKGGDAESAKITLVEYSDFQCPACGAYYPIVKQLVADFGTDVMFVYRHLPIRHIHPNAETAARSAEAAGLQGKFWEMHDMVFENQDYWSNVRNPKKIFADYANVLGLNVEQFESDMELEKIVDKIENDRVDGTGAGVNSTPTFFLDGKKITSPRSYEDFKNVLQKAMDDKNETI